MKLNKNDLFILLIIAVGMLLVNYGIKIYLNNKYDYYIVEGKSMEPNILDGAEVKVNNIKKINRYDVVVLEVNNKIYIKRVIGIPGDTIRFTKEGDTYLNNNLVTWNFETKGITRSIDEEITLDHQFYYVLGDNRDIAYDSRTFGKVSKSQILGVVVNINNSK